MIVPAGTVTVPAQAVLEAEETRIDLEAKNRLLLEESCKKRKGF